MDISTLYISIHYLHNRIDVHVATHYHISGNFRGGYNL